MKLTAKQVGFLEGWRNTFMYDNRRLSKSPFSLLQNKRKVANNERIEMINMILREGTDTSIPVKK